MNYDIITNSKTEISNIRIKCLTTMWAPAMAAIGEASRGATIAILLLLFHFMNYGASFFGFSGLAHVHAS